MLKRSAFIFFISFLLWGSIEGKYSFDEDIPIDDSPDEPKVSRRIVNGTRAILGQFPQQVSLRRRYSQSHFCGGSILTPEWILTASHCMFDVSGNPLKPYTILVIAGEVILKNKDHAYQWSEVKRIIINPQFNPHTLHNDVTLLQLKNPFTFDPFVNAAPIGRTFVRSGTVCQVSGWGYQKHEGNMVSPHLLYVNLPVLSVPLCRKLLWNITALPEGMYCAGYREGGRDACQGDSGGGMLCKGYLTGVVSGGEGCAWPDRPGLYADIKVYLPWIEQYVDLNRKYAVYSHPNKRFEGNEASSFSSSFLALLVSVSYVAYYV